MIADHRLLVAQSSLGEVGLNPMAAKPGGPHTVNIIVTASTYASPAVQDYRSAIADRDEPILLREPVASACSWSPVDVLVRQVKL